MRRDAEHYEQQALDALERAYTAPDGPDGTAHLHLGKAQVYAALAQAAALHQARPGWRGWSPVRLPAVTRERRR